MTDWIEHNGGPQPVDDDAWVEAQWPFSEGRYFSVEPDEMEQASELPWEGNKLRFRILNQHLIDAARLEGIRLGLDAAEKYNRRAFDLIVDALRNTNPDTIAHDVQTVSHQAKCDNLHIAREAQHDS